MQLKHKGTTNFVRAQEVNKKIDKKYLNQRRYLQII